ncbi:hypothetical protein GH810_14500 [Acetobacterium paludosum]|uniref:Uncharacterized protein n=1 Tax=Acetobacterium paludosum TaxID=52693 RepID=A0A923KYD1_9FIRM|nr:phage holin [Acetobacterium paludosum]MBC3889521.1 hypothetical protein [Acetobacterium paludosum]
MNLKIKVQNPAFWLGTVIGIFSIIGGYFGIQGTDVTNWGVVTNTLGAAIANPYVVWIIFIYIIGLFIDTSTLGFKDSPVTMAKISISQTAEDIIKEQQLKAETAETEPETAVTPETTVVATAPTLTAEQASAVITQINSMVTPTEPQVTA